MMMAAHIYERDMEQKTGAWIGALMGLGFKRIWLVIYFYVMMIDSKSGRVTLNTSVFISRRCGNALPGLRRCDD